MNIKLLVFSIYFLSVANCNSSKNIQKNKTANVDEAINFAISDFSKIKKLYKHDSTFWIILYTIPKNPDIVVVDIARNNAKLLLTKDVKVGIKGTFPSRYLVKNGKLFFWEDKDVPLTSEALAVFKQYDLLQHDDNGRRKTASFTIDESKKGAHYYFCKNNFSVYKRVITNIGVGYYTAPLIKCSGE
jgi:hypothetical protein